MTKKHFERFAIMLALIEDDTTRDLVRVAIEDIARYDNARFDAYRFRDAVETLRCAACPSGFSADLFAGWFSRLDAVAQCRASRVTA